jgi:hypothetical protein
MSVLAQRDGWTLETGPPSPPDFPCAAFILRELAVTQEQCAAILYRCGRTGSWFRVPVPGGWVMTLELDRAEAHAIGLLGRDPLTVLAPPLHARSLTLREMMSA